MFVSSFVRIRTNASLHLFIYQGKKRVLVIFGVDSSGEDNCFNFSLASGAYQKISVSFTVTKLLWTALKQRQTYGLNNLEDLQSAICQYEINDFCLVILQGIHFRRTPIKGRHTTMANLVKPFFKDAIEEEESPSTASKCSLISQSVLPSKNNNSITDRYCYFRIFPTFGVTPAFPIGQNEILSKLDALAGNPVLYRCIPTLAFFNREPTYSNVN